MSHVYIDDVLVSEENFYRFVLALDRAVFNPIRLRHNLDLSRRARLSSRFLEGGQR